MFNEAGRYVTILKDSYRFEKSLKAKYVIKQYTPFSQTSESLLILCLYQVPNYIVHGQNDVTFIQQKGIIMLRECTAKMNFYIYHHLEIRNAKDSLVPFRPSLNFLSCCLGLPVFSFEEVS